MNTFGLLHSAALFAMGVSFVSMTQAQVLTADTITGQPILDGYYLQNGGAHTQTFTGADTLDLVTFRFLSVNTNTASISATDVSFLLTSWAGANSTGTVLASGVFSLASGASWTVTGGFLDYFDGTFDFSGLSLNSADTYGISLLGSADTHGLIGIGYTQSAGNALYASGEGFTNSTGGTSLLSGNSPIGEDLSFAAFTGSSSPVPEAGSAAVLFAGVFVGGLMTRRRRRQPVAAVAAQA